MKIATGWTKASVKGLERRIAAIRVERAEAEARGTGAGQVMVQALSHDIAVLERRLAAARVAVR